MAEFQLKSEFRPTGDQPQAIAALTEGLRSGRKMQTLLGVTGSGKTFTMANVIANLNRPTLILEPNKTLAAQICSEMREFFPDNAVEFFVSYYDYYQPEAYIPGKDMYIEKDALVNDEIDRLRHSATSALFERRDVIIVASVSCIYSLGDPSEYSGLVLAVRPGMQMGRDIFIRKLVANSYNRNDLSLVRDCFRVNGDTVEVIPANSSETAIRVEFFGDEIDRLTEINIVTGEVIRVLSYAAIYPATHYAVSDEKREQDWMLRKFPTHDGFYHFMARLNQLYLQHPALWKGDYDPEGFAWLDCHQEARCIYAVERRGGGERLAAVFHFGDRPQTYTLSLPGVKRAETLLDSDWQCFGGGTPEGEARCVLEEAVLRCTLPPFSAVLLKLSE